MRLLAAAVVGSVGLMLGAPAAGATTQPEAKRAIAHVRADVKVLYLASTGKRADPACPNGAPPSCFARTTCEHLYADGDALAAMPAPDGVSAALWTRVQAAGAAYGDAGQACIRLDQRGMGLALMASSDNVEAIRRLDPEWAARFGPHAIGAGTPPSTRPRTRPPEER